MTPFAQGDNRTTRPAGGYYPDPLGTVVEVVECRVREANAYLEHGYFLISVQPTTSPDRLPITGEEFIRHALAYVVGRIRGVPKYDPPPPMLHSPITVVISHPTIIAESDISQQKGMGA